MGLLALAALFAVGADVPRKAGEFVIEHPGAKQELLSQKLKGKKVTMLAFISTTCPHCQTLAQMLSKLEKEYGKQGFRPFWWLTTRRRNLPRFKALFTDGVTLGTSTRDPVHNYLQISMIGPSYVRSCW